MSNRPKTATMASLLLFSCTAFVMGGVSMADDSIPPVAAGDAPHLTPTTSSANADARQKISFAPLKEIVQPLTGTGRVINLDENSPSDTDDKPYSTLAALVAGTDVSAPLDDETRCLATAVFYEARSESLEGQLAVARVIINRSESSRFGEGLCTVIRQPGQFSFVRHGRIPAPKIKRPAWKTAMAIAHIALDNSWESKAEGALYFHARRVAPNWRHTRLAVIDNHIFYR